MKSSTLGQPALTHTASVGQELVAASLCLAQEAIVRVLVGPQSSEGWTGAGGSIGKVAPSQGGICWLLA